MPICIKRIAVRAASIAAAALLLGSVPLQAQEIDFDLEIKSLLSDRCFICHGPDEAQRVTELRLDTREGLYSEVAGQFADHTILAGKPEESEVYRRIIASDEDTVMPPPDSNLSLSKKEIQTLKTWIEQGAKWKGHWSFESVTRPPLPRADTNVPHRALGQIDVFVDARLAQKGLQRSAEAKPHRLIRRLYYDLTGLPPTPEELATAKQDLETGGYEALVDRLLASPLFGERLASEWLDAARYSDTYGFQVDRDRFVWPWRDWVIDAINSDMPYDQFLTEQLAGDLLPDASDDQILATTFNRLHPQKVEGGSVPEEFRIEYVADRTQTFATAVLGLTMECCRCHDHKYDPLSQREYYQLSSFFDNIDEAGLYSYFTSSVPTPTLGIVTEAKKNQMSDLRKQIANLTAESKRILDGERDAFDEWLLAQKGGAKDKSPKVELSGQIKHLDFENQKGPNKSVDGKVGKAVKLTGDDALNLDVGNFRRTQSMSISLWLQSPEKFERSVIFHRSRAWTDAASRGYELLMLDGHLQFSLIHFWPGNAISVATQQPIEIDSWQHVSVTYDGSMRASGIQLFVNGQAVPTKIVRDNLSKTITGGGNDNISIGARFRDRGFKAGLVDEFRVFDRQISAIEVAKLYAHDVPALEIEDATDEAMLFEHFALVESKRMAQHRAEIKKLREQLAGIEDGLQEIMVMRELPSRRQSYLLERGMYDARGEEVTPATPSALSSFADKWPRNRRGLAQWVVDPSNPLTARVAVNRYWQLLFGEGLVRTPEDFGTQGARPTHPRLLDWLAADFMEHDWDVKRLIKQILMSATYRQTSDCSPAIRQQDPENKWLARAPSYRLSAEMLRDGSLAVAGLLDRRVGGQSVNPYEVEVSFKPKKRDTGSGLYRRSVYTFWKRTGPPPAMMTLDASKRDVCRLRRERTSSPLQAFVLLNGPQFVESARLLAMNLLVEFDADRPMLDAMFESLTGRKPTTKELALIGKLFEARTAHFDKDSAAAKALLGVGSSKYEIDLPASRWAALTVVASTIMSFDEAVMRR